jgi:hypothetical protein
VSGGQWRLVYPICFCTSLHPLIKSNEDVFILKNRKKIEKFQRGEYLEKKSKSFKGGSIGKNNCESFKGGSIAFWIKNDF